MQGKFNRGKGGMGPKAPRYAANVEVLLVGKIENGKPLQDVLSARFGLSRRTAKAVIDGRSVWVNRRCVWIAHHTLKTGDTVEIPRAVVSAAKRQSAGSVPTSKGPVPTSKGSVPTSKGPVPTSKGPVPNVKGPVPTSKGPVPNGKGSVPTSKGPVPMAVRHIRIILETKDYIIADKPAGVLANEDSASAEAILRVQLSQPNLQAVHRLDRDTTGCLLFAKTYAAYLAAVEVFKTRRVRKEYRAIVVGEFPLARQRIDAPLDGQPAISHVVREMVGEDASFLKVYIETGRTNQIRRHLAGIRFPIVGDRTFGLKSARDARLMTVPRQMLHASSLELPNPTEKGEVIKVHSPLPADFRATLRLFGMGHRPRTSKR